MELEIVFGRLKKSGKLHIRKGSTGKSVCGRQLDEEAVMKPTKFGAVCIRCEDGWSILVDIERELERRSLEREQREELSRYLRIIDQVEAIESRQEKNLDRRTSKYIRSMDGIRRNPRYLMPFWSRVLSGEMGELTEESVRKLNEIREELKIEHGKWVALTADERRQNKDRLDEIWESLSERSRIRTCRWGERHMFGYWISETSKIRFAVESELEYLVEPQKRGIK